MKPKWQKLASLAQEICSSFSSLVRSLLPKDIPFKNIFHCHYKDKCDALDRGNYRGLNLTEQAMKVLEDCRWSYKMSMDEIPSLR